MNNMAVAMFPGTNAQPQTHDFTNATTVVIDHNLGYYPHVSILVNGYLVMGDVQHNSTNRITVSFQIAISGTVLIG
jgi:hypothetical protein